MGRDRFTRSAYSSASAKFVSEDGPATKRAEQKAHETGKLNPLVDPAGYGVIRRSLPRFEKTKEDFWRLTVGTPMPIETRVDTTGSMGGNVDVAIKVLPNAYEHAESVLPGYDLQIATGIFGDVQDRFVLCRPQFEMVAEKIVEQLTLMVPERAGGDAPEDPQYGLFGAAYLTDRYINRIGLKGYDFTVSDAPARDWLDKRQLIRIYGEEVFEKTTEIFEGRYYVDPKNLPDMAQVVKDLLYFAHAFFLQVGRDFDTANFWQNIFGKERCVVLPRTELLPQVQATIIGLTEGTLNLQQVAKFLEHANVEKEDAKLIVRSVANIPIGAQAALPNFSKRPQKGDIYKNKTDQWPMDRSGKKEKPPKKDDGGVSWL